MLMAMTANPKLLKLSMEVSIDRGGVESQTGPQSWRGSRHSERRGGQGAKSWRIIQLSG
jgi:hypothetical protein